MSVSQRDRKFDRRALLGYAAAAGAMLALVPVSPLEARVRRTRRNGPWSSRATWGGLPPRRGDVAVIAHDVRLNRRTTVAGVVVAPRGRLIFDPARNVTLTSRGNIVVRGRLTAAPKSASIRHRIHFAGIKEGRFKSGGMTVKRSDVGLWVVDRGVLRITGAHKVPWLLASASVEAGSTTVELAGDPIGWRAGDEIAITPTGSPERKGHYDAFDTAKITALSGRTLTLSRATAHAHPVVDLRGTVRGAEVLNLTRNVIIGGGPRGRSHVFIHSRRPQRIQYAAVRFVGPRRGSANPVAGRYGVHFHHCLAGSRESIVRGVVVRDCGNHSFVPHMSHGISFDACIAFDVTGAAYWWDQGDTSNNISYEDCVAARVKGEPNYKAYRLTGFFLGKGTGHVARNCVAAGVWGASEASGFQWPGAKSEGLWTFVDCVAHDNKENGIFVWQNSNRKHVIERFTGYHNGAAGIRHGAYINGYEYKDSILYGNLFAAIDLTALSSPKRQLNFLRVWCDCAGLSDHAVVTGNHILDGRPARFEHDTFRNYRHSAFGFTPKKSKRADEIDVIDCSFDGNEFWMYDTAHPASLIRFQSGADELALRHLNSAEPGIVRPEWNAKVATT